jgi:hypothetical protein
MSKTLTPARRVRLEKLATYLEGLPERYKHFDMSYWVIDSTGNAAEVEYARRNGGVTNCGTAACAAGHGPAAGVPVPPRFIETLWSNAEVNWGGYARALFAGSDANSDWLFAGAWQPIDNHHHGAAARIRYLLDKEGAPEGFAYPACKWMVLYAPYRIDAKAQADA